MSSELEDFLYRLATDGQLLLRFEQRPEDVIADSKLSEYDRKLVLSGDQSGMKRAMGISDPVPQAQATVAVYILDS
jgi:hypothetical protein